MQEKRGPGRPRKQPQPGRKVSLGLKVTPDVKLRLEHSAGWSGRNQSQEAEYRLERSLDIVRLFPEVVTLKYGEQAAAILSALGEAIWYLRLNIPLALALAGKSSMRMQNEWLNDPVVYDAMCDAATMILGHFHPDPKKRRKISPVPRETLDLENIARASAAESVENLSLLGDLRDKFPKPMDEDRK